MKINKVFNKKIIITLIATFTILISGVFGTSKIFAEEGEVFDLIFDKEKMIKTEEHGHVPKLSSDLFDLERSEEENETDFFFNYVLEVKDEIILDKIKNNDNIYFDISFFGLSTKKIKLFEYNELKTKVTWFVTGDFTGLLNNEETDELFGLFFEKVEGSVFNITSNDIMESTKVVFYENDNILKEVDLIVPTLGNGSQIVYIDTEDNIVVDEGPQDGSYIYPNLHFEGFLKTTNYFGERLTQENEFLEIVNQGNSFEVVEPEPEKAKYKIDFVDGFGNVIKTQEVTEGELPTAPENIIHPENYEKYKFIAWSEEIVEATKDATYTAVFEINKFEVKFLDHLGNLIDVQVIEYGESAVAPEVEKEFFDRIFVGWDNEFGNITEDISINAIYAMKTIFTIRFFNSDGSIIEILEIYEGDTVIIPTDFEHPENAEKYKFSKWDRTVELVPKENDSYYAEYIINKFNVKFFDLSGDLISSEIIEYGESAYAPELKKKELFDRVFTGWTEDVFVVTADKEIHAPFKMKNLYTLTFKNYDGSVIEVMTLYEGQRAIIEDPTYESETDSHEYIFINWSDKFNGYAERDAEYTARYRVIRRFNIVFKNIDGTLLSNNIYIEGEKVIVPEDFAHPSGLEKYEFSGWGTEFSSTAEKNTEYVAEYKIKTFTVQFEDLKGKVIDTQIVEYGDSAVYPEFSQETIDRILVGWEGDINNITSNQRFRATFEMKDLFFITFKNIDGTIIEVLELYKGQPIEAPLATFISDNELFEYVFTNWDKELDEIAERNIEYTAQYDVAKRFRVTFKNSDGSIILEEIYLEGDLVNAPRNIKHPENEAKFKFIGWDSEITSATENKNYIAQYEINKFTVSFYDNDNKLIERQTVLYGENAIHPEKELDKFDRIFIEWDSSLENITTNTTINAIYEMKKIYTYTFLNYDKSVIEVLEFYEGQKVIAPEANYKSGQNSFDFTFSHWSPELQSVATEDAIYEAVYDVVEKYKITFKDLEGNIVSEQLILKGEMPSIPELDHPTEHHKFIQDGWNTKVVPAGSDQVYEVRYKLRTFTVDFYFSHKTQRISRQVIEYGSDAVAPNTDQERYRFVEWDLDFTNVTEDIRVTGIFEENEHVLINFFDTDGNIIHSIKNYGDIEIVDLQREYSVIFNQPLHKFGFDISKIYELIITEDSEEKLYYNFGKTLELNGYREYNFIIEYAERELHEVKIVLFDGTEVTEFVYDGYFPKIDIPSVPDYKFYGFVHNGEFLKEEGITPGHIGIRIYKNETIRLFYTDNSGFYKNLELGKNYEIHDIPNYRTWLFKDLEIEAGNYHFIFKSGNETRIVNIVISENSINMMVASIAPTRQKLLLGSGYFIVNSQTIIGDKIVVENINSDYEFLTFFSTREGQFSLNKGHVDFSDEDIDETPGDNENPYIPPKTEWKLTIQNILILLFGIVALVIVYKAFRWIFPGKKKRGGRR